MTKFKQSTHGKYCLTRGCYVYCKHRIIWHEDGYPCDGSDCVEDHMVDFKCDENCKYFEEI